MQDHHPGHSSTDKPLQRGAANLCGVIALVPQPSCFAVKAYEQDSPVLWRKVRDYQAGTVFYGFEMPLCRLDDLAGLITSVADENVFLIRGDFSPAARSLIAIHGDEARFNRRLHPKFPGDEPHFTDIPRHWIMVDVDSWRIPADLNIRDVEDHEEIIDRLIRDLLPAPFHDVRAYYQWSNSAGQVLNTAKVHLFFWLTHALGSREVRNRFKAHCPAIIDLSPFSAVQPHFVANPIFLTGRDPMPCRFGWRDGIDDEVDLPPVPPHRAATPPATGFGPALGASWLKSALSRIGDGAGVDGFHEPIRNLIWAYSGQVLRGALCRIDAQIISVVSRRVRSAPVRNDRSVSDIERYAAPDALQRQINEAFAKRRASASHQI